MFPPFGSVIRIKYPLFASKFIEPSPFLGTGTNLFPDHSNTLSITIFEYTSSNIAACDTPMLFQP